MGPFRRTRASLRAAETSAGGAPTPPAFEVRAHEYRRLGHALATVVVTLAPAPPAGARLRIASEGSDGEVAAMLVTHEAPGTPGESHRVWFLVDLSRVMFGDARFTLLAAGAEVDLPEPAARPAWDGAEPGIAAAGSQSELRAALTALEERCRSAERLADKLRADERRLSRVVAVTIDDVQAEREALLARLRDAERDRQELRAQLDAQGDELDRVRAAARQERERLAGSTGGGQASGGAVLARIDAARGAASAAE